jgi:hypothetical protein
MGSRSPETQIKRARELALKERRERKQAKNDDAAEPGEPSTTVDENDDAAEPDVPVTAES